MTPPKAARARLSSRSSSGSSSRPAASQGFVLVNALVLVAAMASVAVLLLARAQGAQARLVQTQTTAQIEQYLGAAETWALTVLNQDPNAVDHMSDSWAQNSVAVPLDRGHVTGTVQDLQARFNLNRLANPQDAAAAETFGLLLLDLGLSPQLGDRIRAFLSPQGPQTTQGFASATPATDPVGGALGLVQQLRDIPGLSDRTLTRLSPYMAALPGDAQLNVNTVSPQVLAAHLPGANAVAMDQLMLDRRSDPFGSVDGFITALAGVVSAETLEDLDPGQFSVSSSWFELHSTADLAGRQIQRQTVIRRQPLPRGAQVLYRVTQWD